MVWDILKSVYILPEKALGFAGGPVQICNFPFRDVKYTRTASQRNKSAGKLKHTAGKKTPLSIDLNPVYNSNHQYLG